MGLTFEKLARASPFVSFPAPLFPTSVSWTPALMLLATPAKSRKNRSPRPLFLYSADHNIAALCLFPQVSARRWNPMWLKKKNSQWILNNRRTDFLLRSYNCIVVTFQHCFNVLCILWIQELRSQISSQLSLAPLLHVHTFLSLTDSSLLPIVWTLAFFFPFPCEKRGYKAPFGSNW